MAGKQNKSRPAVNLLDSNQWLRYTLYALAVATPLLYSQLSFNRFDLPKMAFMRLVVVVALAIWLFQLLKQGQIVFRWTRADLLLLIFIILAGLSSIFSINSWISLLGHYNRYEGLFTFFNYALIYLLAAQVFSEKKYLNELSLVILIVAYIVAGYGILQFFGIDPLIGMLSKNFEAKRIFSTLGNPDFLGGYLAMLLPIALTRFIDIETRNFYLIHGLGAILIGTALLLTFTRGAWLAAIVGLFYLAYRRRRFIKSHLGRFGMIAIVFLVIFIAVFLLTSNYSSSVNLGNRIKSAVQLSTGSMATRVQTWKSALKMIQSHPLLGFGPDTFRYPFQRYETLAYAKAGAGSNLTNNAHNYPLHLAAGVGLPAAVIFFVFIFWLLYIIIKADINNENESNTLYQGLSAGIVAYMVYLLAGISVVGGTATFALILGALVGTLSTNIKFQTSFSDIKGKLFIIFATAVLLVTIIAAVFGVTMLAADTITLSARGEAARRLDDAVAAKIRLASHLYPGNGVYFSDLGYYYQQYPFGDKKELMAQAVGSFKAAIAAEPLASEYHEALGRVYLDQGKIESSINELKQALRLRPLYVAARYWLGVAYYQQGRFKLAVKNLLTIQEIAPGYANSYGGLADSFKALDEQTKANYYYGLSKDKDSR